MSEHSDQSFGVNSWLAEELRTQYQHDQKTVDETWQKEFGTNGAAKAPNGSGVAVASAAPVMAAKAPPTANGVAPTPGAELVALRGAAGAIAQNMTASLAVPTATSQRVIPVKVIEENRNLLNSFRGLQGKSKISYTHLIGWALIKSAEAVPAINHGFVEQGGTMYRQMRSGVNLGLAVDVAGKDGNRSLMVPNIKNANALTFTGYLKAFDDIVVRARNAKLALPDFQGTTISLTNPGTVGTLGSVPRLMDGQGAIIATGAIDFPAEYQGVAPELRAQLGLSKVMMVTCTYDHRIIQGAESGAFLGKIQELLQGGEGFYTQIFTELEVPYPPVTLQPDRVAGVASIAGAVDAAKQVAVGQLINAYRINGHFLADLDPLAVSARFHPELDPAQYGLTIWDLDRVFPVGNFRLLDKKGRPQAQATLREMLDALRATYSGKIGVEYMYLQEPAEREWLQDHMEPARNMLALDAEAKKRILNRLLEAEEFEHFLQNRFIGKKRFSLEGAESTIAALDEMLEQAATQNVAEAVIGMAHRGRLNVLNNIVGKPAQQIFSEFDDNPHPERIPGSGDVKYHLGASGVRRLTNGREVTVSLAFNPSHLEAVDPVVEGMTRPKQDRLGDTSRTRVIPILIHGDAAFAGQGVVAETMNLSQLEGYATGGTIHLIINNQIGFTTMPNDARSSPYASDVAHAIKAPVIHVNGDEPEAVVTAARLAYAYRQEFKKDIVIDLVCYRRYGHNEGDEPSYTQPVLYRKIKDHASVAMLYSQRLVKEKLLTAAEVETTRKSLNTRLADAHEASKQTAEKYEVQELAANEGDDTGPSPETPISRDMAERVIRGATTLPEGFTIHPKLKGQLLEKRAEALSGAPMDYGTAEMVAFGSLVLEGTPVRLTGQDVGRGTFNHRHATYFDYETGRRVIPLQLLAPDQAPFNVFNSSLSEYAAMGYEFGYTLADPQSLVVWEAQFGDFVNGAQIMIDQFISCAETKWGQPSGLVLLLPHGYEGQGPEHSSARLERFLQLCAENNLQVVNCTTPAQYFHLLRRQMYGGPERRGMRKPLVVFTPKSLLRDPRAASRLEDLTSGSFRNVIGEESQEVVASGVTRVLLCSGKVFYDLRDARDKNAANHVAVVRLEQMYPFPAHELQDVLARYPAAAEVVWVQEEPRNMGPWRFMQEHVQPLLDVSKRALRYVGRPESASPAAGSEKRHKQEQAEIVAGAFAAAPIAPTLKRTRVVRKKK